MKRPEEVRLEFTRDWVLKAEADFKAARFLGTSGDEFSFGTAFHAQQSAEKYLKALLVWHQVEFPKTHDIKVLLTIVSQIEASLSEAIADAIELTPYGVEYRYPGQYPELTRADVKQSLTLCSKVRREVRKHLPTESVKTARPSSKRSKKR